MVYTNNRTATRPFITFPAWVKKSSKCATHSHKTLYAGPHGDRIIISRTVRIDNRKRHSLANCVAVHTTLVR